MGCEQISIGVDPVSSASPNPPTEHRRRTTAFTCTSCRVTFLAPPPDARCFKSEGWVCEVCSARTEGERPVSPDNRPASEDSTRGDLKDLVSGQPAGREA